MARVLLKLSGEALAGDKKHGFDEETVLAVGRQVKKVMDSGAELAVVIGGGNFWRGRTSGNMERSKADQIGMMATIMNCLYTSEIFRSLGMKTAIFTPFAVGTFTEPFAIDRVNEALAEGRVVFFAGGTGHPYFSTDTATALRAVEIGAEYILLAKAVDGIYDSDPKTNPEAKRFETISIAEVVQRGLKAVDGAAAVLCEENKMPMRVFALQGEDSILRAAEGTFDGTTVTV